MSVSQCVVCLLAYIRQVMTVLTGPREQRDAQTYALEGLPLKVDVAGVLEFAASAIRARAGIDFE